MVRTILIALILMAPMAQAETLPIETDKAAHFAISALIAQNLYKHTDMKKTIAGTLILGLAKEMTDPVFDKRDLMADIAGISLGVVLEW